MNKYFKNISIILCLQLIFTILPVIPIHASTTEDLYNKYNLTYVSSLSENVTDTIKAANDIEILSVQYNNILAIDTYNKDVQEKLKQECDDLELKLLNGYNLNYSVILDLEQEYENAKKRYDDYVAKMSADHTLSVSVDYIPTKQELYNARVERAQYIDATELGSLSINNIPTNSSNYVDNDEYTNYIGSGDVRAVFNGVVTKVKDDTIEITSADYVVVKMKGLNDINVNEQDTVKQGDIIGTYDTRILVGLGIGDKHFNLSRLREV